jgi:hypothetical protein
MSEVQDRIFMPASSDTNGETNPGVEGYEIGGGILCIDLDRASLAQTRARIKGIQDAEIAPELGEDLFAGDVHISPCVVILGSTNKTDDESIRELVEAGAVFVPKPDGFDDLDHENKLRLLSSKFGQQDYDSDVRNATDLEIDRALDQPRSRYSDSSGDDNISVYDDPPFQIDEESFDNLLERMRNSDEE